MLGQRRGQWANNSTALGELVVFDRLHTHRQRLMHRQHERSQVNQHVSTSIEGRHNKNHIVASEDCFQDCFSRTIGDNGKLGLLRLHL